MSFDEFLYRIYNEVGASTLKFNPRRYFPLDIIVPTEYDSLFRQSLIHGYVHDEGAALLNGVSGHAGLFGNANDVMKIMQLYLNKGAYGGKRYITDKIVDEWTKYAFPDLNIRRGIAFDKKDFNPSVSNAPVNASELAFGHSGFTGTYVWVDPMFDLNYVFLSNRVYPTRENKKLITLNIRPKIGELLIKAIQKSK